MVHRCRADVTDATLNIGEHRLQHRLLSAFVRTQHRLHQAFRSRERIEPAPNKPERLVLERGRPITTSPKSGPKATSGAGASPQKFTDGEAGRVEKHVLRRMVQHRRMLLSIFRCRPVQCPRATFRQSLERNPLAFRTDARGCHPCSRYRCCVCLPAFLRRIWRPHADPRASGCVASQRARPASTGTSQRQEAKRSEWRAHSLA